MEKTINIESTTWFDFLPTEIIFIILEYLSTNDIIYTFTDFSQRLKNLLLQNQRYLTSLVLPTTNLNIWKNILLIVGSQIKCLIIESDELTIPLEYFANLKSIVNFLPYGSSDEQIKLIVESDQFHNFHSLKIKKHKSFSHELFHDSTKNQNGILENSILDTIFNNKNSLEIFEYTILTEPYKPINTNNFTINFNLHSLILTSVRFDDIFPLIEYTPNLKYLNIHSQPPSQHKILMNKININLKELHLKFTNNLLTPNLVYNSGIYYGNLLMDIIKQFSSSLICLSLNLINLLIRYPTDTFPFNITKLPEFLESMKELKQFHLYARINKNSYNFDNNFILTKFRDQYWFDHRWSFGMYGNYLFTLPFFFNDLHEFPNNFNDIQTNNPAILENNSRIWFNVKSLELSNTYPYDINFVRELKLKMPKLNFIKFKHNKSIPRRKTEVGFSKNDRKNKADLILNRVTTIQVTGGSIQQIKQWLIHSLPNLEHLILSSIDFSSMDNQIGQILNEKIEELDIYKSSNVEKLTEINYIYFSNVQRINFWLNDYNKESQWFANIIMKMLKNFKNLKKLLIYHAAPGITVYRHCTWNWTEVLKCLNVQEIEKNYQIKHYENYSVFSKIFC